MLQFWHSDYESLSCRLFLPTLAMTLACLCHRPVFGYQGDSGFLNGLKICRVAGHKRQIESNGHCCNKTVGEFERKATPPCRRLDNGCHQIVGEPSVDVREIARACLRTLLFSTRNTANFRFADLAGNEAPLLLHRD